MKKSTLHLHTSFVVDKVDPRVFGGFLEHLGRAVYEGVFQPESKNADELGCSTTVLHALRRLKFTAMRYPGGNFVSGYHWLDAVGPREKRPTVRDLAWQSIETNQFGPNEFIELSRKMDWTPMMAVNLSVWENVESLERFVWQTVHKRFYGRRGEWFERMEERYFVMWWVPAGHRPTVAEAIERLEHMRAHGETDHAFGWQSLPSAKLWQTARCA